MKYAICFLSICVWMAPSNVQAVIDLLVEIPHDDMGAFFTVKNHAASTPVATAGNAIEDAVRALAVKPQVIENLGPPIAWDPKDFVRPCSLPHGIGLPGMRHVDETKNKDHSEVYALSPVACVHVYYGIDGSGIVGVVMYLRVDDKFVALPEHLRVTDVTLPAVASQRLAWETMQFNKVQAWIQEKGMVGKKK